MKMTNSITGIAITVGVMALAGCNGNTDPQPSVGSSSSAIQNVSCSINSDYLIDPEDKRQVAGVSGNVLIGKVAEKTGEKTDGAASRTTFRVDNLRNMKGDLAPSVTIYQTGTAACPNADVPLLEAGQYYVLALDSVGPPQKLIKAYATTQDAAETAARDLNQAGGVIREVVQAVS
ncbi:hypothetical protein ACLQ3K_06540 [Tsukamurella sp. DT100]|uniref:hypothetical protein n=1 Tax=Tsukamurella sp. DT100 TaxID=3393415 RepID=UPI003CEB0572